METIITRSAKEAAAVIKRGGIVAFPTETVYGLGADVFRPDAIARIFAAKGRPADNPLIVHIADISQLRLLTSDLTASAEKLIAEFFPGPLTVVVKKAASVPAIATAGLETVGVRMPSNETAREFLAACETPVVAPSANLSGRPSPTDPHAVAEDLSGRIDCILAAEPTVIGLESTVVDCTGDVPVLLRPGAVSADEIRRVAGEIRDASGADDGLLARSPGTRYQHYSPRARVVMIRSEEQLPPGEKNAFIGIHPPKGETAMRKIVSDADEYARELFAFFRECDRAGIATIYCEAIDDTGIGRAVMDRVRRASE